MRRFIASLLVGVLICCSAVIFAADEKTQVSSKDALQQFNDLIGEWKGTGIPKGSAQAAQKGFWIEKMNWSWQFKGQDAWLTVDFTDGKYYDKGELRYLPAKESYQLTLWGKDQKSYVFEGSYADRRLTLYCELEKNAKQKLVIRLLHSNRFLYQSDVLEDGKSFYKKLYQVGCTKQGVVFAKGNGQPECIVSGGLGTMKVSYMGKEYYVCCNGCRQEFEATPEKYIKEYEAKKAEENNQDK